MLALLTNRVYSFLLILLSSGTFILTSSCKKTDEPCVEKTWYQDADKDGRGAKAITKMACDQPTGYVADATDDDDNPVKQPVVYVPPTKGYTTPTSYASLSLVWADEFNGTTLNDKNWNYEIGTGCPNNCGWGNQELEYYRQENTSVKDGLLLIEAKAESFLGRAYTSSRLTTKDKVNINYGRIDIRAALPKGQGVWPALWMLGKNIDAVNWPKCGEIDIMELIGGSGTMGPGNDSKLYGTAHWDDNNKQASFGGNTSLASGIFNDEFHVFSIIWDAKKIAWYLDDKKFHEIDTTPAGLDEFQKEFFFVFNVAVGGNWGGNPDNSTKLPQVMAVDYVRVFK